MATGLWKQKGVPHKGWSCVGVTDIREDDPDGDLVTCEMCDVQEIRYVHHMTHPDFDRQLDVGCVCAEKMEEDRKSARRREAPLRSRAARRARWLSQGWLRSKLGNEYREFLGYRVVVFPAQQNRGWSGIIVNISTGKETRAKKVHQSSDQVKLAALNTIERWQQKKG
jgi:hypothetical protein